MKTWTRECSNGCGETVPTLREDLVWTCPPCARELVSVGWPAPDKPCERDAECGRSCESDGYGGFAYEGQRGGNGDPVEDVYFVCSCEHHGP